MPEVHVRQARQADTEGMARVRVDTWRATYTGIVPSEFLEKMSYQSTADRWKTTFWQERAPSVEAFVAENQQKEIVGIAICGPEQSQDVEYQGEVYVLYVLPQYQHQGIGRQLIRACVRHLTEYLKVESMLIWVIAENPYRRFYESLGGALVQEKTKDIGGKMISEFAYGWKEIRNLA